MLVALIKTMRPKQWVKNGVIFAALVFDRQLGLNNLQAMLRTVAGFVIFCLLSGVVYIINDIADVEADRKHPKKSNRPIAAGSLPIPVARGVAVVAGGHFPPLICCPRRLPWLRWPICCST